jgi:hypothetical protein
MESRICGQEQGFPEEFVDFLVSIRTADHLQEPVGQASQWFWKATGIPLRRQARMVWPVPPASGWAGSRIDEYGF